MHLPASRFGGRDVHGIDLPGARPAGRNELAMTPLRDRLEGKAQASRENNREAHVSTREGAGSEGDYQFTVLLQLCLG